MEQEVGCSFPATVWPDQFERRAMSEWSDNGGAANALSTAGIYKSLLGGELEGDEAVRASQQMLQMVMASIPQAVFWKDRSLRFLGCNQVFADMAGLDQEEIVGRTDLELFWAADEAGSYRHWDERVIESGRPRYEIHEPIHRADGELRWLETNKVPLFDFNGEVVGLLGTSQDVTARLRTQQQLSEALSELDERVRERTGALSAANEALRQQVEERARLQELERQQRAYAEALRDTAAAFNQAVDIDDVLEQVVESLFRLIDIDVGAVLIVGDDGRMTLARSGVIAGNELEPGYPEGLGATVASLEPFDSTVIDCSEPTWEGARLAVGSQAVLVAPISLAGKPMGYVVAESSVPNRFSESDGKGIRFIADQAAAAFTSVQLISQARELAAIDERQHLARELHDAVSQTLWTACLSAEALATTDDPAQFRGEIDRLRTLSRGALAEMRTLLLELRPAAIEDADLPGLIDQLIDAFASRKNTRIERDLEEIDDIAIDSKLSLYRIVQEALNNVARHATPDEVVVSLHSYADTIQIEVHDNGGGFDVAAVPPGHFGLRIMAERAEAAGGSCTIDSRNGTTTIFATVPREANG